MLFTVTIAAGSILLSGEIMWGLGVAEFACMAWLGATGDGVTIGGMGAGEAGPWKAWC